jgi:putative FmdB family regulatory protein
MPTYDYKCKDCGEIFEYFQSIKDDPFTVCEKCNGEIKRMIGKGAGIIFKGSGFYVNDYKNSGSSTPAKSSETTDNKTAPKSEGATSKSSADTKTTAAGKKESA